MKYPQNTAERILKIKNLPIIKKNACCAFVFLWCLGIEPDDDLTAIELVDEAINKEYIYPDCTVTWWKWGKALTGRDITVEKIEITTIKRIKERSPVWYSIDGVSGHWVGVENGVIKFDPNKTSRNVALGKPRTMRKITIKK